MAPGRIIAGLCLLYAEARQAMSADGVGEAERTALRNHWAALCEFHGADFMDALTDWREPKLAALRLMAEGPMTYRVRISRVAYADVEIAQPGQRAAEAYGQLLADDDDWTPPGGWTGRWGAAGVAG